MDIANNIKRYRTILHMEQAELAKLLNISNKTISSWECGRTEPRMGMVEEMCRIFGCTKDELIGTTQDQAQDQTEQELIFIYRGMNEEGQTDLIKYARYLSSQTEYIKSRKSEMVDA